MDLHIVIQKNFMKFRIGRVLEDVSLYSLHVVTGDQLYVVGEENGLAGYYTARFVCPLEPNESIVCIEKNRLYINAWIEKAEIWVPYGEVFKHYRSIKVKLCKRIRHGADAGGKIHNQHPNQRVNFMNMCMVSDGQGNVAALEKVSGSYQGTTFPGGHVERNETFAEAVIGK